MYTIVDFPYFQSTSHQKEIGVYLESCIWIKQKPSCYQTNLMIPSFRQTAQMLGV